MTNGLSAASPSNSPAELSGCTIARQKRPRAQGRAPSRERPRRGRRRLEATGARRRNRTRHPKTVGLPHRRDVSRSGGRLLVPPRAWLARRPPRQRRNPAPSGRVTDGPRRSPGRASSDPAPGPARERDRDGSASSCRGLASAPRQQTQPRASPTTHAVSRVAPCPAQGAIRRLFHDPNLACPTGAAALPRSGRRSLMSVQIPPPL
jgi:hypothetical protein